MTNAFLTGSRAYGTPRFDSDVDLCLLVSKEDEAKLRKMYGQQDGTIRCEDLNLIPLTDPKKFGAWAKATEYLKGIAPVDRETAVKAIKYEEKLVGIDRDERRYS